MMTAEDSLLHDLLSQPTAPFREALVIALISKTLEEARIPYFSDPVGNLVIGVKSKAEYLKLLSKKSEEPLKIFVAHMDHPGFHGVRWNSDGELDVKWHGGSPTKHLDQAKVWISDDQGSIFTGRLKNPEMLPSGRALSHATVVLDRESQSATSASKRPPEEFFGGLHFRSFVWKENDLIYTKAADDLIGTFAILTLALKTWGERKVHSAPFLGLLTRAEEVGFIGAIGHFELGWFRKAKRPLLCVSLETSRTLPGAEIGKGPVVRLGDRYTVFDAGALRVFTDLAQTLLPEKHQRRIMDGGTCEATAATVYGIPSIGISVPLGNYHNQSFEGGPDAAPTHGPAPEFVHQHDLNGLISLCQGIIQPKQKWSNPWGSKLREFRKELKAYQPLLKAGIRKLS